MECIFLENKGKKLVKRVIFFKDIGVIEIVYVVFNEFIVLFLNFVYFFFLMIIGFSKYDGLFGCFWVIFNSI